MFIPPDAFRLRILIITLSDQDHVISKNLHVLSNVLIISLCGNETANERFIFNNQDKENVSS